MRRYRFIKKSFSCAQCGSRKALEYSDDILEDIVSNRLSVNEDYIFCKDCRKKLTTLHRSYVYSAEQSYGPVLAPTYCMYISKQNDKESFVLTHCTYLFFVKSLFDNVCMYINWAVNTNLYNNLHMP